MTTAEFENDPRYGDYNSVGSTEIGGRPAVKFADTLGVSGLKLSLRP